MTMNLHALFGFLPIAVITVAAFFAEMRRRRPK
jgi:hypothetical protein